VVEVPDLSGDRSLDEAIKDVDDALNVATSANLNPDPGVYIPLVVKSTINVLEAAAKEPTVKSLVYTSSQAACVTAEPGNPYSVTTASTTLL
jgi:nucleoside-diphosphate-sugar epimerase